MRAALTRWRRGPLERASEVLLRAAKGDERRRMKRMREVRSGGTNALHKAQYINAFVESRSVTLSRQQRFDALLPSSSSESLMALAGELESRYGGGAAGAAAAGGGPSPPVAFGAWREDDEDAQRLSRRADFILHCVLREARTPPGWSEEALGRQLPLHSPPVAALMASVAAGAAAAVAGGEGARGRFLKALRESHEALLLSGDGLALSDAQRRALTSLLLQRLVAATGAWRAAFEYLRLRLEPGAAQTAGPTAAPSPSDYRKDASQQIAVFAEAVRYADLPRCDAIPLTSLEGLMEVVEQRLSSRAGGRLAPVVAAPVLSIVGHGAEGAARVAAFCRRHLYHYTWRRASGAAGAGRQRVYLPAAAWGEYLRALGRGGASRAEIQAAVDGITDPARTHHAEEVLLHSVHVWNGYLASVRDAAHAVEVFRSNRQHYGLRHTPATIAVLMEALARHGSGAESVKEGLLLYKQLKGSAGRWVVGTASVFTSLTALYEASADLRALLRLCVDYHEFLVYFGVAEAWWSGEAGGSDLLQRLDAIAPEGQTPLLLAAVPEYAAFVDLVVSLHAVPPAVQHALRGALERVAEALEKEEAKRADEPQLPLLSAEDLADFM